jgi:hypothetical protein
MVTVLRKVKENCGRSIVNMSSGLLLALFIPLTM